LTVEKKVRETNTGRRYSKEDRKEKEIHITFWLEKIIENNGWNDEICCKS
jgi:hypothetical protein